jgi:hypothetical protein
MYYTNYTGNMSFPIYSPSDSVAAQWIDINSAISQDVYWYSRELECGGSVAGEVWTNGSGAPQRNGSGYNDLSLPECHRPSNYGYMIDHTRYLDGLSGTRRPLYAFVENGHPFVDPSNTITPDQMSGAVWSSLIHEARGINYFNHSFGGPCQSSHNFRDPIISSRTCYTAMRAKAKEINGRVKQLAPVLNTQSYQYKFDPNLDTMLKSYGGSYYIFAMASGIKGGTATGSHTLQLPAGLNGSTVEVLFENRTLPINVSRQFTDSFAADYTYHIYKVTP